MTVPFTLMPGLEAEEEDEEDEDDKHDLPADEFYVAIESLSGQVTADPNFHREYRVQVSGGYSLVAKTIPGTQTSSISNEPIHNPSVKFYNLATNFQDSSYNFAVTRLLHFARPQTKAQFTNFIYDNFRPIFQDPANFCLVRRQYPEETSEVVIYFRAWVPCSLFRAALAGGQR